MMTTKDKQHLLCRYIGTLFSQIRGDWGDPRFECREGWEAIGRLKELLFGEARTYSHSGGREGDDDYYIRIEAALAEMEAAR